MPSRPRTPCTQPGCPALATERGRCAMHQRPAWQRERVPERTRGRTLQRLRDRLLRGQPLCVLCAQEGRMGAATDRDHIIPLAEGGSDTDENVQALCKDCHRAKTLAEARRGRGGKCLES